MSQNVLALAVLLLLCAPGLLGSQEPHPTNVHQTGSSYQDTGPGVVQDRNTRSSVTNLMPVYPISNRQNSHNAVQETLNDFRSYHGGEPQKIPAYVIRPPHSTRLKTHLAHGSSNPEMDGLNSSRLSSPFGVGSTNRMISSLATAERSVTANPLIPVTGEPNKIPIYVIRPPYPGTASPTLVNMAVLPQEQINPDIIRILQSLRLSPDRVPLVVVAGSIPALNADVKIDTDSGPNTLDFGSPEGRSNPIMSMIAPHSSSDEEWYDEEMMKHETLIHGRRPSSYPNIGRFGQVYPQLHVKPSVPPPAYRLPDLMNTESFLLPKGRNGPVHILPAQQNTPPRMIMPQNYYRPTKDQVPIGFSNSLRYDPIPQTRIPDYSIVDGEESPYASETAKKSLPNDLTQHPQLPRQFVPSLQQKPGYASTDRDLSLREQYLTYPSSDIKELRIPPYPSQQHPHSSLYKSQAPYDFQTPSSSVFPSSDGRVTSTQEPHEVISQIGRLTIPQYPSRYPFIYPKNVTNYPYTKPKEPYPGQQTKYPFIKKIPQDNLQNPSYPYSPGMEVFSTPERPHLIPQLKYSQYPSFESEGLRNHRDPQPAYSSQPLHFPPYSQSPEYTYRPSPQYPSRAGKQMPIIQPRPNIHTQIEELLNTEKPQQIPPEPYSQFPSASQDAPSDYHTSFPHQIHPKQKPMYPSGGKVPSSPTLIYYPESDEEKLNMQSTPDLLARIGKIEGPGLHTDPQIRFSPYAPTPYPIATSPHQDVPGQQPQYITTPPTHYLNQIPQEIPQYPSTDTVETGSSINTLDLPSDQQPEFSPDGQLFGYPRDDISPYTYGREPSMNQRPEIRFDTKKFDIPRKLYPRPQQKDPQYPSSGTGESTNFPEKSADEPYQYPERPSDGKSINYPKQPADYEQPLMIPRSDIDPGITKPTLSEPITLNSHQRYPKFPSTVNGEPTYYPGSGSQQPSKGTHPHFPSVGPVSGYPRQPIGETELRTDFVPEIEKFSTAQPYPKLQQKYLHMPSSDTDKPAYHPDSPPQQTYKGEHADSQPHGQVPSHPRQPMDETEPQVRPRPEIVSNIEEFRIPERPYLMPQQKYPYIPSSDTDEPTYYPNSRPREPYKGTHPDFPAHGEVTSYPRQPLVEAEAQVQPRPDIVSNIEKFSIPEQLYPMPQQQHPHIPSSDTNEPSSYPDTGPQQLYEGRRPDFLSVEEATGDPKATADQPEPQWRPASDVFSNIDKFSRPEQPYLTPLQKHPHVLSSGSDEATYYPDSGPRQPYRGQRPEFSHIGLATSYPKHPVDDAEPEMRPIPDVVSNLERIDIPEQPFSKHIQQSPQFPYSDNYEPNYYPDSGSREPYKGTHPDFPSHGQASVYPRQHMDDSEPQIKPRTDVVSETETVSVTEIPYPKPRQKYLGVPTSEIDEPMNYPDIRPQQPHEGSHPDLPPNGRVASYPRMVETKPQMRPRHEIVSNIQEFGLLDQPYPVAQQVNPQIPSSGTIEQTYYPNRGPEQPQIGQYPDFPLEKHVTGYPRQSMDDTEPQMRSRPNVVSEVENFSITHQPYQKPQQKYPHISPSDADEQVYHSENDPQEPRGHLADFPSHNQDVRFPKMDDREEKLRPIPDIISNIEAFNIPGQPYPTRLPKFRQSPSSDTEEVTKYPEIPRESNDALYPEIPAYGQTLRYPKQDSNGSKQMLRPQPVVISELKKFNMPEKPHIEPHQRYPELSSADTDGTRKNLDRRPLPDQQPESASDGQISSYPMYPSGYQDSSLRPRPETVSEIDKFLIPEQHNLKPQQEYPRSPSSDTDEQIYHTDSSMQHPYYKYPESDYRLHGYSKQPTEDTEPMMRPRLESDSEIRKFNIPHEHHPMPGQKLPQYHSAGTETLGEGPKPSYTEEQPWLPSDSHIPGQHHPQQPSTRSENSPIQPKSNVPAHIERLHITEKPHPGLIEKYPWHPSVDTDDGQTVYLDAIQKHQSLDQEPKFNAEIPVSMSYPVTTHPYFSEGLLIKPRPNVQSQIKKFNIPTGGSPQHPSSGSRESVEPHQPRKKPPLPYDLAFSTETPSRQHPLSFNQQVQSPYQNLVPSHQDQGYPQYTFTNGEELSWQPRPEVRAQVGKTVTPEKTLIKPDMHGHVQNLNTTPQQQYTDYQPQWLFDGAAPTDYPDQFPPQYPSSFSKPPSIRPYTGPQTKRFEVPKSSGRAVEPQYPSLKRPRFDNQLPKQEPTFPTDISVPTKSQQDIPQYPSFDDSRISERPDIVSKIGVFRIPETPELKSQQKSPQHVSSDTKEPVHYHDPYQQQVPSGQPHPSSFETHHPYQYSLQHPPSTDMSPSFLPMQDLTAQIGRMHIPEQQKPLEEDDPQNSSKGNSGPEQRPTTLPQQMPDTPVQQSLSDTYSTDIPNLRTVQYPSSENLLHLPDSFTSLSGSTLSPLEPRTPGRVFGPEKQVYPKEEHMSPTLDIAANVERFRVLEGSHFRPSGQEYIPKGGTLPQRDTHSVPGMDLRPSNDIDINIERLTVPGQMPWQPEPRYPPYPSSGMQKPDEYTESYSLNPDQRPRPQMTPNHQLPVGGDGLPGNGNNYPSSYQHRPPGIHPAADYLPDVPQQSSLPSLFPPDDGEPQYYPLNEPNYPHGLSPGYESVGEEPKHLKKPTVFVYPVPRRPEVPTIESYVPQLQRSPSGPLSGVLGSELYSYPPGTHDYLVPVDGQTPTYPQLYPDETSPSILQYDPQSKPIQPDDFPKDNSRPHQSPPRPFGSPVHLPGTVERQEPDGQTSVEGYVSETSLEPSTQVQYSTSIYPKSLPRQSVASPVGTVVYPQPSAEQITVTSTRTYPDEQQNNPGTTTVQYPNPIETNKFISSGPVIEGTPERSTVRPGSQDLATQAPHSPYDISRTELSGGQESSPQDSQPPGEPKKSPEPIYGDSSSVNTLDFPYSTEGVNERKPGSTTTPENVERGFYPDEALTTTSQTTGTGSAPDQLSITQTTQVVMPTGKQLLSEPSSGVTDFPSQPSTLFEPGVFPVSPDSPQIPTGPSLQPDSKITRIFPVTKPTFYTDKDGQKFVSLKLLNEPIPTSPTGEVIPHELTDSPRPPGTTDIVIPIGRDVSDTATPSPPQNPTQPHPMLKGIPIGNVQVFDAQTIIKLIESCNCSNLKFLIPILKRPQSAIVVANNEYPGIAN